MRRFREAVLATVASHGARVSRASYASELRDPRWQKLRLEVFQRDQFCCQACGGSDKTLHAHHHWYFFGWKPWDYELDMLTTLCADCHKAITEELDDLRYALAWLHPRDVKQAKDYLLSLSGSEIVKGPEQS